MKSNSGCIIRLVLLVIVCFLLWTISKGGSSTVLTMDQYNRIQIGMPYESVVRIIGFQGYEALQIGDSITLHWKDGGSVITCVFTNGLVSAKTHNGLSP